MSKFKVRDAVVWRTPFGMAHGEIIMKVTSSTNIDGLYIQATEDNPRYVVRSSGSGLLDARAADDLQRL